MINKKFLLSVAACGLLALFPFGSSKAEDIADSDSTFYGKVFYNTTIMREKPDFKTSGLNQVYSVNTTGGGLGFGYYFAGLRVELEGFLSTKINTNPETGIKSGITSADNNQEGLNAQILKNKGFSHITGVLGGYYDFPLSEDSPVVPYVGGGAGLSYVTQSLAVGDGSAKDVECLHLTILGKVGIAMHLKSAIVYGGYKIQRMLDKEYNYNDIIGKKPTIGHVLQYVEAGVMFSM